MINIRELLAKMQTIDASIQNNESRRQDLKTSFSAFKKAWFQLLTQTTFPLTEVLDFFQTTQVLITSCDKMLEKPLSSISLTFQYSSEVPNLIKNILSVANSFQDAITHCFNSLMNIKILETMKRLYEQTPIKLDESYGQFPTSKDFLSALDAHLHHICTAAFQKLQEEDDTFSISASVFMLAPEQQKDYFLKYSKALSHRIKLLGTFHHLAQKSQGVFLRHLNQSEQPMTRLTGLQCTGFIIDWGHCLQKSFTGPETVSKGSNILSHTLLALQAKQFPKQWPSIEMFAGGPITCLKTMKYQRIYSKLFSCVKMAQENIQIVSAQKIMEKAKTLFSCPKKNPVSVLTIILEQSSGETSSRHMMGLARIYFPKTIHEPEKLVYRFCDADYAEFEAYSEKTIEQLLHGYLNEVGHSARYNCASLQNIDPVLEKLEKYLEKHLEKFSIFEIDEMANAVAEEPWLIKSSTAVQRDKVAT